MKMSYKKRTIIRSIVVYVVIMLLFFLMSLQNKWEIGQREYYLWSIASEMFGAILSFVAIAAFGLKKRIGLQIYGFGYGLCVGVLMLVYSVAYFVVNAFTYGFENFIFPNVLNLVLVVVMMASVALFEELLFRGLLLNTFLDCFADTRRKMLISVFASSILFGSSHFMNLIVRPELFILTLCQAIYTVFAGVFFSSVYLRSENLWSVIFYHTLFDVSTTVFYEILPPSILQNANVHYASGIDQGLGQGLFYVVASIPLLICGLMNLKKVSFPKKGIQSSIF